MSASATRPGTATPSAPRRGRPTPRGDAGPDGRVRDVQAIVGTLNRIFQVVDQFSRASLRRFGVSGPQLWALRVVSASPDLTMGALSRRLYLHASTVSGIVDRLEARRLVVRRRRQPDSRVVTLRLTAGGRRVLERAPEPPRSRVSAGLLRLAPRSIRAVRSAVQILERLMRSPELGP